MLLPFSSLPFCAEQNRKNITKKYDFLSLKNRMGRFRIESETASDIVFLYCIKVGALNLAPLW